MTRAQARKHDRICARILAILAVVVVVHMIVTTAIGNKRQQMEIEVNTKTIELREGEKSR